MEDKNDKDLLNYVKNYNIPKKEPKYEDRHVVIPLPSKKRNKNDNKETKKKSSKLKRVSDKKDSNLTKKDAKKETNNKNIGKTNKEINYDEMIKNMESNNKYLNEQIKRRENHIEKYKKKYQDQQNIIKSLELILSEQKEQKNSKSNSHNDKNINDIDYVNDILANDIESLDLENIDNLGNEDILYDENFQEDFAIKAVDQQIIDELYPNPDTMSYEQLLQLEDIWEV